MMVKERPIIMMGDSVRGILAGRKRQTRRVIKNPQRLEGLMLKGEEGEWCPYGKVGDRLWVRETHARWSNEHDNIIYSDNPEYIQLGQQNKLLVAITQKSQECSDLMEPVGHWEKVPSIFMPKWAARLWLEITGIRVERLQEVAKDYGKDLRPEGVPFMFPSRGKRRSTCFRLAREKFIKRWDSINAKRGHPWDANPWVWVIEFTKGGAK